MYNVPFFNIFKRSRINNSSYYKEERIGTFEFPEKLNDANAFNLAQTVTEIFWPIDFCADRVSKLRFFIADKNGKEVTNTELLRFIDSNAKDFINPFFSFNELVYQKIFSWYADGNGFNLLSVPESLRGNGQATVNNITRSDIIQPNLVSIDEYTNIPIYKAGSYNDIIMQVRIDDGYSQPIDKSLFCVSKNDSTIRTGSAFLGRSILYKGLRPINNLLAVYSARYNSYVNNGAAGLLVRKSGGRSDESLNSVINGDPVTRKAIIDDLNDRKGLTGTRQFWGITNQPVEFINTIATIKDLMPMEETLENSIKIAAIMQLPSGLVPRKDNSTYDNQDAIEATVWENSLKSITDSVCASFTREFRLNTIGYAIKADYSSVSALAANESAQEDIIAKRLANLLTLQQASNDNQKKAIEIEIEKIIQHYGQGQ